VVWRPGGAEPEILIIHRPKYDDWSLPKGKAEEGEDDLACALREVAEETALACEVGVELPSISYTDGQGRAKTVRYWLMRPKADRAEAQNEVDDLRWLPVSEAIRMLTYEHDRSLIEQLPPLR
jgi:8-oxo-dGTP diphosphatase